MQPTSKSTLAVPVSAVAGDHVDATLTVTSDPGTDLSGTAQLLVAGKAVGKAVDVTGTGDATVTLPVPTSVTGTVGAYQLTATFTGTPDSIDSAADAQPLTVLPATLPWSLVDENGKAVTNPISSPEVYGHATGQLPGSTVHAEVFQDGKRVNDDELGELESADVAADGTVDVPIVTPVLLTMGEDDISKDQTFSVVLVAELKVGDTTTTLRSASKDLTVGGLKAPIDLAVDPGPYRAGEGVENLVRVSISWIGFTLVAEPQDIADMIDAGELKIYVDGKALKAKDVDIETADDETAVVTFAAPTTAGDHTVQAVLEETEPDFRSASEVGHFVVAPSTFDAALLDEDGNEVTEIHRGQELEAVAAGLLPGTKVSFVLHSSPTTLGTATADEDGIAAVAVTIPSDVTAGDHTLVVTATDVLGDEHVEKVALVAVVPVDDPTGELAETGSNVAPLVIGGALLLIVGAGLVLVRRRRA
nr:Ig-like domain repeat protein [Cellulomonas sp. JH27-2]